MYHICMSKSSDENSTAKVTTRGAGDGPSRKVKAICSYSPLNEEELKLEVNDVIEVISFEEGGYSRGRLNGKVGLFPSECTKPVDGSVSPLVKSQMTLDGTSENVTASEIQPKKIHGVGFGNIFVKDAKIELKSKNKFDFSPKSIETKDFSPKVEKKMTHYFPPLVPAKPLKPSSSAQGQVAATPVDTAKFLKSPVLQESGGGANAAGRPSSSSKQATTAAMTTSTASGSVDKKDNAAATDTSSDADMSSSSSPLGKKSGKTSETAGGGVDDSLSTFAETNDAKCFDRLNENEKLSHLTAYRPRLVNRRPPSKVLISDMKEHIAEDSTHLPLTLVTAKENAFSRENFVSRESFETLQAAFELFKKETVTRMKELERKICSLERKGKL
ncbi:unnamed protein product [Soboliphyme baturini]|uniref:SH3 domain-containing protein n=1 Tax=Soboliphyme baturini TaxID=241478 RepID=A0A183IHM6_9BILA|nr:unnamed protein product [Soboliphyme baturini]